MRKSSVLAALAVSLTGCSGAARSTLPSPNSETPPPIEREMRGLWVTTVGNTDWPSKDTLAADQQRAELVALLDRAVVGKFNAVMFQVRPAADAVYASELEPWAALLTGKQGKDPGYDPLAFAVQEAHARGLEIHVWINPYRAGNAKDTLLLASSHIFNTRRELVRIYGTQVWMDPGEPEVQDQTIRVVNDIVRRYDIDGVHADDYFYPYRQNDASGKEIDFPDSASYMRSGSTLSRDDWRRSNVDRFIERMYREVHAIKPMVKVGISPFGIWRPRNPASVTGLDAYQSIYADSRKWLQEGWVDYFVPQLYWAISSPGQSYPALFDWWLSQNTLNRHVWPGLATYRVGSGAASQFGPSEIRDQIVITRARAGGTGNIFFNTKTTILKENAVVASFADLYANTAVMPAYPWLDATPPPAPSLSVVSSLVQITPGAGESARWWVLRARAAGAWTTRIIFGTQVSVPVAANTDRVVVNAVDAAGNLSSAVSWARP